MCLASTLEDQGRVGWVRLTSGGAIEVVWEWAALGCSGGGGVDGRAADPHGASGGNGLCTLSASTCFWRVDGAF